MILIILLSLIIVVITVVIIISQQFSNLYVTDLVKVKENIEFDIRNIKTAIDQDLSIVYCVCNNCNKCILFHIRNLHKVVMCQVLAEI